MLIERQQKGSVAVYHFIKLYCIAARCNQRGGIFIAENLPHTAKTLAKQWNCKETTVNRSLELLIDTGLLEVKENVFYIADWDITQSADRLEEIREKARLRKRKQRENERSLKADMSRDSHVTSRLRIDKDKEKEIDIDGDGDKSITEYVNAFNTTDFPKIKILSSEQKASILKAIDEFGLERLKESLITASKSEFLKGKNANGWVAHFDWLIKPENIAKVLNGNYNELYSASPPIAETLSSFDGDEFVNAALSRGFE